MAKAPVISKPRISIESDGKWLEYDAITSMDFICNESAFLPRCVVRFADPGGMKLSTFQGLGMGARVNFLVSDDDKDNEYRKSGNEKMYSYNLTPLTIADVAGMFQGGQGDLELLLEHPWKMFKDFSSHAYSGKPNSEIIRSLVENASSRGFKFENIDSAMFSNSDEKGEIPRYKCSESDLDFIVNKILPYTTINKSPVIFFVDEKNNVHLSSFNDMFAKDPKMMIVFGTEAEITDENRAEAKAMNGITLASKRQYEIGDEDPAKLVEILKANISFDDCSALFTYTGTLLPKVAIGKYSESNTQSGYVPISLQAMATTDATDKKFYRHHMIDDLKAVALNAQNRFNSFFSIEVTTLFCGNMVTTGDNVQMVIPPDTAEKPALNDWMNGKWHVKAVRYEYDKMNDTFKNKLTLTRPSFMINKKNTTLYDYNYFYSVGMGLY